MALLEYYYVQTLRMLERNGTRDPHDVAFGQLIGMTGVYAAGVIGLLMAGTGVNFIGIAADYMPTISEHSKFLKPVHLVGMGLFLVVLALVAPRFRRARIPVIERRFHDMRREEVERAWRTWLLFSLGALVFMLSAMMLPPLAIAVLVALAFWNYAINRRFPRVAE